MSTANKEKFVIVGGRTAGAITANILAHTCNDIEITLIEDQSVPTIGVGEGSTPALKSFFELLGIAESEWMRLSMWTSGSEILPFYIATD